MRRAVVGYVTFAPLALTAFAATEFESFSNGGFSNPFFQHAIEFDDACCWSIADCENLQSRGENQCRYHLHPNTDFISFDLAPGERVQSVSLEILDFEGGFVGDAPTSVAIVRSPSDFVVLRADKIAVAQVVSADVNSPGQLTGEPLGEIVQLQLQAANEGNSVVPGVGAMFDRITVVVDPGCPGDLNGDQQVDLSDLAILLANFGAPGGADPDDGDLDGDGDVDLADLSLQLAAFGTSCA
jgi:hypothetical protein